MAGWGANEILRLALGVKPICSERLIAPSTYYSSLSVASMLGFRSACIQ